MVIKGVRKDTFGRILLFVITEEYCMWKPRSAALNFWTETLTSSCFWAWVHGVDTNQWKSNPRLKKGARSGPTHQPFKCFSRCFCFTERHVHPLASSCIWWMGNANDLINSKLIIQQQTTQHQQQRNTTMNSITSILVLILASVQLSSALLFSPLLLRTNPFGVVSPKRSMKAPEIRQSAPITSTPVDYGHDDEVLRYKYELLQSVYEKSLERGFDEH